MSLDTCHLFNLTRLYIYIYIQILCIFTCKSKVWQVVRQCWSMSGSSPLKSQFDTFKSSGGWTLNPTKPNLCIFCVYLYVKAKFGKWSESVGRCQVPLLSSLNSTHSNRVADGPLIQLNPT